MIGSSPRFYSSILTATLDAVMTSYSVVDEQQNPLWKSQISHELNFGLVKNNNGFYV